MSGTGIRDETSLDAAITHLRRRYGTAALRRGGEAAPPGTWPSGVPVLDGLCGGGLPRGRVTVLAAAGRGATGRLTLLQALAATASRSMEVAYVDLAGSADPGFLADLGADLGACLVLRPPEGSQAVGLAMARTLVAAGVPWLGVALGRRGSARRDLAAEHALAALAATVEGAGAVACVAAGTPLGAPLAHASSLTLACSPLGWQEAHGDVVGLRVGLRVVKSKLGVAEEEAALLLRYPRPQAAAEVVGLPSVVPAGSGAVPAWVDPPAAARLASAR